MKRELLQLRRGDSCCCPGHDKYPNETYKNRRSKKARAQGKKSEHKTVRALYKRLMNRGEL